MKRLRKLLILLLFSLYCVGLLAGAVREVRVPEEAEMYEYLEQGIKEYDTEGTNGIKTAGKDNLIIFAMLVAGSLFKPLVWLIGVAMLVKGYLTGFSVMAMLRLYGIKGIVLCISNLLSVAFLIPSSIYYGGVNASGLLGVCEKRAFYRRFFWATVFLVAIFCADAIIKGTVSPIFVKWASKLFKT